MKVLKKAAIAVRGEIEHTMTEKNVLAKIRHPFLVRMHYSFQNEVRSATACCEVSLL